MGWDLCKLFLKETDYPDSTLCPKRSTIDGGSPIPQMRYRCSQHLSARTVHRRDIYGLEMTLDDSLVSKELSELATEILRKCMYFQKDERSMSETSTVVQREETSTSEKYSQAVTAVQRRFGKVRKSPFVLKYKRKKVVTIGLLYGESVRYLVS